VQGTAEWSVSPALLPGQWNEISMTATDSLDKDSTRIFHIFSKPQLSTPNVPDFGYIGGNNVELSWKPVGFCTHYLLLRSDQSSGGPWDTAAGMIPDTTWSDTGLALGTTYWYQVLGFYSIEGFDEGDTTVPSPTAEVRTKLWFQKLYGGGGTEEGHDIQKTADSGYIIAGRTNTPPIAGSFDAWLLKVDRFGDTLWTGKYGGDQLDGANSVQQTEDGGYILCGTTASYAGTANNALFLVKTDSTGSQLWQKSYSSGTGYNNSCNCVRQTEDGGYILTGSYNEPDTAGTDIWVLKTNASGDTTWTRRFGESGKYESGTHIIITRNNGYAVTGGTESFGAGNMDIFLLKLSLAGDSLWLQRHGGPEADGARSVLQTPDNGFIIAGNIGSMTAAENDAYLIKTDSVGREVWNNTYGGVRNDYFNSIQPVSSGGYIIAGTSATSDNLGNDVYLMYTDDSGGEIWSTTLGGDRNDWGKAVLETSDGGFIICGTSASFTGGSQLYLIKTDRDGNSPDLP
jgi:hypothetical protein